MFNLLALCRRRFANVPFKLADIGEGITEVQVLKWFVKEGDPIKQFDKIAEVQSDKASVEISSRFDGRISKLHYKVDDMAKVGDPLVDIETDEPAINEAKSDASRVDGSATMKESIEREVVHSENKTKSFDRGPNSVLATPAVRILAKQKGINLNEIVGTGRNGRITKEDLAKETSIKQDNTREQNILKERKGLTMHQNAMVKEMTRSMTIPHFGYCDDICVDQLLELKRSLNENEKKFTLMPFFIKAASLALKEFAILNSSLEGDSIVYHKHHNISFAMDTPQGLMVPVIHNAESKTIEEINNDLKKLQAKPSFSPTDLKGGTFSLSNIGSIGGTVCSPVIVSPQVCIGALGKIKSRVVFEEDDLVETQILTISWSADHRIIDGATMARFSNLWKLYCEEPFRMLPKL